MISTGSAPCGSAFCSVSVGISCPTVTTCLPFTAPVKKTIAPRISAKFFISVTPLFFANDSQVPDLSASCLSSITWFAGSFCFRGSEPAPAEWHAWMLRPAQDNFRLFCFFQARTERLCPWISGRSFCRSLHRPGTAASHLERVSTRHACSGSRRARRRLPWQTHSRRFLRRMPTLLRKPERRVLFIVVIRHTKKGALLLPWEPFRLSCRRR